MAVRSELARDEVVRVVGEHAAMLRTLGQRAKAVLERNALFGIADAYRRYETAQQDEDRHPSPKR